MFLRSTRTDVSAVAASALCLVAATYAVRHPEQSGIAGVTAVAALLAATALLRLPKRRPVTRDSASDTIEITPHGVRRAVPVGHSDTVPWEEIMEVTALTMSGARDEEDVFIVVRATGEQSVIVPHTVAVESGLLSALEARLGGFDRSAFAMALNSAADRVFLLWRAPISKLLFNN